MTRKYVCDNCGKESENKDEFLTLAWLTVESNEIEENGEFCTECQEKIRNFVSEGFQ